MMTFFPISKRPAALAALTVLLGLSVAVSGAALPQYPGYVRDDLSMACTPKCTLCHELSVPTAPPNGTVPFFENAITGVIDDDQARLSSMLAELGDADSDMDGMPDLVELKDTSTPGLSARDPNVAGPGDICSSEVHYGCGSQMAPGPGFPTSIGAVGMSAAFGAALFLARRRLRRD